MYYKCRHLFMKDGFERVKWWRYKRIWTCIFCEFSTFRDDSSDVFDERPMNHGRCVAVKGLNTISKGARRRSERA